MSRTKADVIADMLREYRDARETLNGPRDYPGDGTSVQLMPPTWNDSYRQLEQILDYMHHDRRRQWWHTTQRYRDAVVKRERVYLDDRDRIRLPHHAELVSRSWTKNRDRTAYVLVRKWDPAVRQKVADDGVRWIASQFKGEPFLHPELRRQQLAA